MEKILQKRKDKYRYNTVSDFICAAALDDQIKVVTVVHQAPIRSWSTVTQPASASSLPPRQPNERVHHLVGEGYELER